MKNILITLFLVCITFTAFANTSEFILSKSQQNRLNLIIKQLKLPYGEYKLSVQSSWATIEKFILPTTEIQVVEKERIVTETKTIEVPKEVIVEKILPDPQVNTLKDRISELENQISTLKNQLSISEIQSSAYRWCLTWKWSRACGY